MKKLLYTKNIPFNMRDWKREPIEKVYAGTNCILAITTDGRVLQKTNKPEVAVRTQYWTRIKQIAVSGWASCHAIGLVSDGTCIVAKRALRHLHEVHSDPIPFDLVNDRVKTWKQIKQVAVSDSYFALDNMGRVHVASASQSEQSDYIDVESWKDVSRIAPCPQNGILGVTNDGNILCGGYALTNERTAHGDIRGKMSEIHDVADICETGAESSETVIVQKDGTVIMFDGDFSVLPVKASVETLKSGSSVLQRHFNYEVILLDENKRLVRISGGESSDVFKRCPPISSFAIGDCNYGPSFTIAVTEE